MLATLFISLLSVASPVCDTLLQAATVTALKESVSVDRLPSPVTVLRGPQGTLYVRNAMGGVLALQSIAPIDGMRRGFHIEYGSANSVQVGGIYTLGQHVLTAQYRHSDGFFLNEYKNRNCDPYDGLSLHWRYIESWASSMA